MLYGPNVADDLASNRDYRNRTNDSLHLLDNRIDAQEYALTLQRKPTELIDYSRASLITVYLKQLLKGLEEVVLSGNPLLPEVNVVINYYPFNLDDEALSWLAAGIKVNLSLANPVSLICLPPKELTLDFLSKNAFFSYIMYDFDTWTNAALPDEDVSDLATLNLARQEGLTIVGCRNIIDVNKGIEVDRESARLGLPPQLTDLITLPWTFLFDLELIEHIFFTEYNETIADIIMTKTNSVMSPIDIEVEVIGDYYHVLGESFSYPKRLAYLIECNGAIQTELLRVQDILSRGYDDETAFLVRGLLAEHRFISDALSYLLPTKPAEDFERYIDYKMSFFDISREGADITERDWNKKKVRCRRVEREVPAKRIAIYMTLCLEDCVDTDGVSHKKGDLLAAHSMAEPILEPTMPAMIEHTVREFVK